MNSFSTTLRSCSAALVALAALSGMGSSLRADEAALPKRFKAPEEAVQALTDAARSGNPASLDPLFGPDLKGLLSGDEKQDALEFASFSKAVLQYTNLVKKADDRYVLDIGAKNWPMPVPIVLRDGTWLFDAKAGKDEVLSRRIGRDETLAIGVCRTYVQAQREYASLDRDGSGVLKYALHLKSSEGQRDGLYWPADPGQEQSPFGPLVAEARAEGYGGKASDGKPQPFHGYRFKILTAQGAAAPGGAYNYVINGNLIGGFALVAYPAHWGESGIMTFIVNQWGKVYQANLGEQSADLAQAMTEFNPDSNWSPVP